MKKGGNVTGEGSQVDDRQSTTFWNPLDYQSRTTIILLREREGRNDPNQIATRNHLIICKINETERSMVYPRGAIRSQRNQKQRGKKLNSRLILKRRASGQERRVSFSKVSGCEEKKEEGRNAIFKCRDSVGGSGDDRETGTV